MAPGKLIVSGVKDVEHLWIIIPLSCSLDPPYPLKKGENQDKKCKGGFSITSCFKPTLCSLKPAPKGLSVSRSYKLQ